jgi:hypothetical protein
MISSTSTVNPFHNVLAPLWSSKTRINQHLPLARLLAVTCNRKFWWSGSEVELLAAVHHRELPSTFLSQQFQPPPNLTMSKRKQPSDAPPNGDPMSEDGSSDEVRLPHLNSLNSVANECTGHGDD